MSLTMKYHKHLTQDGFSMLESLSPKFYFHKSEPYHKLAAANPSKNARCPPCCGVANNIFGFALQKGKTKHINV